MTTVAILASGPSLSDADIEVVRRAGIRSFVVNDTYRRMPDASALFAADAAWWQAHPEAEQFKGEKYVSEDQRIACARFVAPRAPNYGGNSALRAAHLADDQGASRILLLGVDLNDDALTHWHGLHQHETLANPNAEAFERARVAWAIYADTYDRPHLINCSRRTSLTCFQRMTIEEALAEVTA